MIAAESKPQSLPKNAVVYTLLQVEGKVRDVQNQQELQFLFVNETRRLVPTTSNLTDPSDPVDTELSGKSRIERPVGGSHRAIDAMDRAIDWRSAQDLDRAGHVSRHGSGLSCRAQTRLEGIYSRLWIVVSSQAPRGQILGGLWLTRDQPWADYELPILQRLSEAYAYAWRAVGPSNSRRWRWGLSRTTTWILAAAMLGALAIPVPMSTLAPAKIVAKDPLIVSAPIDGVIAEILVLPNTVVSEGQVLLKYEDTTFRNDYQVSERNLDVSMAHYRRAAQGSFGDAEQKADVPLLKAEVELRETERNYAHERLTKVEVKAERDGLLLYTDKSDWIGKPVVVGQRIMELANPQQLEVRIDLPVEDAIVLREGAPVKLFLNANPFSSVSATVSHASYHAEVLSNNKLTYRVTAQLEQGSSEFRIGWQGSAKIYGKQVMLFTYLFRRPISAIRPWIGL